MVYLMEDSLYEEEQEKTFPSQDDYSALNYKLLTDINFDLDLIIEMIVDEMIEAGENVIPNPAYPEDPEADEYIELTKVQLIEGMKSSGYISSLGMPIFTGKLDGNGHKFYGLESSNFNSNEGAMFEVIQDAEIKNLDIYLGNELTSIAGTAQGTSVTFNNVNIYNAYESTIVTVNDNNESPYVFFSSADELNFINCTNNANFVAETTYFAVFLGGYTFGEGTKTINFTNCINYGDIKASGSVSMLYGNPNLKSPVLNIENCVNFGDFASPAAANVFSLIKGSINEFGANAVIYGSVTQSGTYTCIPAMTHTLNTATDTVKLEADGTFGLGTYVLNYFIYASSYEGYTQRVSFTASKVIDANDVSTIDFEVPVYKFVNYDTAVSKGIIEGYDYNVMYEEIEANWTQMVGYDYYYTIVDDFIVVAFLGANQYYDFALTQKVYIDVTYLDADGNIVSIIPTTSKTQTLTFELKFTAEETINAQESVDYLYNNVYGQIANTNGGDPEYYTEYEIREMVGNLNENFFYTAVGDVRGEEVTSIQINDAVFNAGEPISTSIHYNVFLRDAAFRVIDNTLYVASVILATEMLTADEIIINETTFALNNTTSSVNPLTMQTPTLSNTAGNTMSVNDNNLLINYVDETSGTILSFHYTDEDEKAAERMVLTKKIWVKNGEQKIYGYTFTKVDGAGLMMLCPLYTGTAFDEGTKALYKSQSLSYTFYVVGLGVSPEYIIDFEFLHYDQDEEVQISDAIGYMYQNVYNKVANTKNGEADYISASETAFGNDGAPSFYALIGTVDQEITSVSLNGVTYSQEDTIDLSIGNNVFIRENAFFVEDGNLYITVVSAAFEYFTAGTIYLNGVEYAVSDLNVQELDCQAELRNSANDLEDGKVTINDETKDNLRIYFTYDGMKNTHIVMTKKVKATSQGTTISYGFTPATDFSFYPAYNSSGLDDDEKAKLADTTLTYYAFVMDMAQNLELEQRLVGIIPAMEFTFEFAKNEA